MTSTAKARLGAFCWLLWSGAPAGLELGAPLVHSQLGEPLRVSIPLAEDPPPPVSVQVDIPTYWEQRSLGLDDPRLAGRMSAQIAKDAEGRRWVQIRSEDRVDEASLSFLLRLRGPGIDRNVPYELLIDPAGWPLSAAQADPLAPEAIDTRFAGLKTPRLDTWTAQGRIAVKAGNQGGQSTLRWTQDGPAFEIRLSGPLGQVIADISGGEQGYELRTADNERYVADSAHELLERAIGISLPLSGVRYWLAGRPQPDRPVDAYELDESGRLRRLEQGGWSIRYAGYADFQGKSLPTALTMRNGEVFAKVLLKRWELPAAA